VAQLLDGAIDGRLIDSVTRGRAPRFGRRLMPFGFSQLGKASLKELPAFSGKLLDTLKDILYCGFTHVGLSMIAAI